MAQAALHGLNPISPAGTNCSQSAFAMMEMASMHDDARLREEIQFLRHAVEHLDDKAKGDLKVALYGSGFFLALSLILYGHLPHASLLVSAVDLWYFMSWGSDQLRLIQHRDELKRLEGEGGLEHNSERHPNFTYERLLYYLTPFVILGLFIAGLIRDHQTITEPAWRTLYFVVVGATFLAIVVILLIGLTRQRVTRMI
jgi:hypothetical protein